MKLKIFGKKRMGMGLLAGVLSILGLNAAEVRGDGNNLIASHDRNSSNYKRNCTDCHGNILTEKSLNATIRNAHVAMLPNTPGESNNVKCSWCHRTVDLVQGTSRVENSKGNLRKGVDMTLCALCHSPSGPGKQFYQNELIPTDGAALYELACAACHRSLANSEVKGESASEIQKKINENEGGMGPLRVLTTEEIRAIAAALAR
jgi:hypothetical protein